jgi:lipopolysaccharide transport system ATP-binding protein
MYVRLAFSVAAHLEPEILLVDEVLAVGDAEFQRRCLGRMEDFSQQGRTVLFVSHNMQTIAQLCDRVILLDAGEIVMDGPSAEVVARYLQSEQGTGSERVWADLGTAPGGDVARLRSVRVIQDEEVVAAVDVRRPVGIEIGFTVLRPGKQVFPKIKLLDGQGDVAFNALDTSSRWHEPAGPGDYLATAWIPSNLLNEGLMSVEVGVCGLGGAKLHHFAGKRDAVSFHVHDPGEGDSARGRFAGQLKGVVRPLLDWTSEEAEFPR